MDKPHLEEELPVSWGSLFCYLAVPAGDLPQRMVYVWQSPVAGPGRLLFMQDGEKVFRREGPGIHSWRMPETLQGLWEQNGMEPPLVVAVSSTRNRAGEYMPEKAVSGPKALQFIAAHHDRIYVPRADAYLRFLVSELKPWVESSWTLRAGREHVAMVGSSRGALFSMYAVCEYPDVFAGAACLSPHWPHGDGIVIDWLEEHLPHAGEHRFYFDYGDQGLDAAYEPYQLRMDALMERRGYRRGLDWQTVSCPGDGHDELYWGKRIDKPLAFLFANRRRTDAAKEITEI